MPLAWKRRRDDADVSNGGKRGEDTGTDGDVVGAGVSTDDEPDQLEVEVVSKPKPRKRAAAKKKK